VQSCLIARPVYLAIMRGNFDMALSLLNRGASLEGCEWEHPLNRAVRANQLEIVKTIVSFTGPSVITRETVYWAIRYQKSELAMMLLGEKPSLSKEDLSSLLLNALIWETKEVGIELFRNFNAGLDPNFSYKEVAIDGTSQLVYESLLMQAVRWGDYELCHHILINRPDSTHYINRKGQTAFDIAMELGHSEIASLINSF
jgi:hypothetical protein